MSPKSISRREFLKTAGIILGSAVVVGTGLTFLDTPQANLNFPDQTYGEKNMSKKVLVTYATQGGSTAGIAEEIGKTLAKAGAQVDVRNVNSVSDLSSYQAVVIGSAIHGGKWLPEAIKFVEGNQSILRQMPTAIFQVCMMLATDNEQYKAMIPAWLDPIRSKINPAAATSFAGGIDLAQYPKFTDKLGLRIFLASVKLKPGDYRNWDSIRTWAENLRPSLVG
ncbi:MAG TPA: flavodoxin domain-containing protein [Anaerolineaceae bacterium]|nr:flavodoxin domain-containing protein [Anaerolineaceae bacterium]